jgi:hypothetical protein
MKNSLLLVRLYISTPFPHTDKRRFRLYCSGLTFSCNEEAIGTGDDGSQAVVHGLLALLLCRDMFYMANPVCFQSHALPWCLTNMPMAKYTKRC